MKLIVYDCSHDDSHADVSLSLVGGYYSKTFDSRMFTPPPPLLTNSEGMEAVEFAGNRGWFPFRRLRRVLDDDSSR